MMHPPQEFRLLTEHLPKYRISCRFWMEFLDADRLPQDCVYPELSRPETPLA